MRFSALTYLFIAFRSILFAALCATMVIGLATFVCQFQLLGDIRLRVGGGRIYALGPWGHYPGGLDLSRSFLGEIPLLESLLTFGVVFCPLYYLIALVKRRRLNPRNADEGCITCGYSLIGNKSGVCPECGTNTGIVVRTPARSFLLWRTSIFTASVFLVATGVGACFDEGSSVWESPSVRIEIRQNQLNVSVPSSATYGHSGHYAFSKFTLALGVAAGAGLVFFPICWRRRLVPK